MFHRTVALSSLTMFLILALDSAAPADPAPYERIEYRRKGFLEGIPRLVGFDGSSAILEFDTVYPTARVRVYYGTTLVEEDLGLPRYRRAAVERFPEGETTSAHHSVKIDVARLEAPILDAGLIEDGGGNVEYRVEIFDPSSSEVHLYESRFRYKREGDPATGEYSPGVALVEGPVLDLVSHESAVISWGTDSPTSGSVIMGDKEFIAGDISSHHEVKVTGLSPGVAYGYRVKYTPTGDLSRECVFRTAPAPGSRSGFKFGFIADSRSGVGGGERSLNGVNVRDLSGFLTALYRRGADLICFGGDLIDGYTTSMNDFELQLRAWKMTTQPVACRIPVYEAMGNHEQVGDYFKIPDPTNEDSYLIAFTDRGGDESAEASFEREFVNPVGSAYGSPPPAPERRFQGAGGLEVGPTYAENVYSFNYDNVHFVAANTNYWFTGLITSRSKLNMSEEEANNFALAELGGNREGYIRANQLSWLDADLGAAQDDPNIDWIFVFLHEPPFPNGGHVEDAMYWGQEVDGVSVGYNNPDAPLGDVVDMRDRFWTTLNKYDKVLVVLAGDEHNYSRTLIDSAFDPGYRLPLWQMTSGGCGAPYYGMDSSVPWTGGVRSFSRSKHCCLFTVEEYKVRLEVYSDSGELLDSVEDLASIRD